MDDLVFETVHTTGGIKNGALVRRIHPTSLSTLMCFTTPDGLYHVHNRIEFDDDDPRHWTHYVHHDRECFLEREHQAWMRSRGQFLHDLEQPDSNASREGWQRSYFRGPAPGQCPAGVEHRVKLRLAPFTRDEDG